MREIYIDRMPKRIIEAALFISARPLKLEELAKIAGIGSLGNVRDILEELRKEYNERGIEIVETKEGWYMQVKNDILPLVAHLTPYADLSNGHKRTLALIAYKEPITQSSIVKIQGNKAYSYLKFLERKGLIKTEKVKRTKYVYLTKEFERYFGEEKEKIRERILKELDQETIDKLERLSMEKSKANKKQSVTISDREEGKGQHAGIDDNMGENEEFLQ